MRNIEIISNSLNFRYDSENLQNTIDFFIYLGCAIEDDNERWSKPEGVCFFYSHIKHSIAALTGRCEHFRFKIQENTLKYKFNTSLDRINYVFFIYKSSYNSLALSFSIKKTQAR